MLDALFTASSRSAGFCRSRRQRFITALHVALILPRHQPDTNGMQSCGQRSKGSGMKTIRSMVFARMSHCAPLVQEQWRMHQMKRERFDVARCTVARLMKQIGIRGAVRGKVVKTTVPDTSASCPRDKVNRQFRAPAPNMLWVSDFTYVSTWQGFVYVAIRRENGPPDRFLTLLIHRHVC
jgi:transposase InsO family protein